MDEEERNVFGTPRKKRAKKPKVYGNIYAEQYQRSLEKMKRDTYRLPAPYMFGRTYWWVYGFTDLGKGVILGPYLTKEEADVVSVQLDTYELFNLKTRDKSRATQEVKAELLARGGDPDEALKRMLHKVPKQEAAVKKKRFW